MTEHAELDPQPTVDAAAVVTSAATSATVVLRRARARAAEGERKSERCDRSTVIKRWRVWARRRWRPEDRGLAPGRVGSQTGFAGRGRDERVEAGERITLSREALGRRRARRIVEPRTHPEGPTFFELPLSGGASRRAFPGFCPMLPERAGAASGASARDASS